MAETLNPIPVCEQCGSETVRVKSTAGKGRYQCTQCSNKKYYIRSSKKASKEDELYTEEEREKMVERVNASIAKDFDGSRRRYADQVSTSEALRRRAKEGLAETNGHHNKDTTLGYKFKPLGHKEIDI